MCVLCPNDKKSVWNTRQMLFGQESIPRPRGWSRAHSRRGRDRRRCGDSLRHRVAPEGRSPAQRPARIAISRIRGTPQGHRNSELDQGCSRPRPSRNQRPRPSPPPLPTAYRQCGRCSSRLSISAVSFASRATWSRKRDARLPPTPTVRCSLTPGGLGREVRIIRGTGRPHERRGVGGVRLSPVRGAAGSVRWLHRRAERSRGRERLERRSRIMRQRPVGYINPIRPVGTGVLGSRYRDSASSPNERASDLRTHLSSGSVHEDVEAAWRRSLPGQLIVARSLAWAAGSRASTTDGPLRQALLAESA